MAEVAILALREERQMGHALAYAMEQAGLHAVFVDEDDETPPQSACFVFVVGDVAAQTPAFTETASRTSQSRRALIARFTRRPMPLNLRTGMVFDLVDWAPEVPSAEFEGLCAEAARVVQRVQRSRPPPPPEPPPARAHASTADTLSSESVAWRAIRNSTDPEAFRAFLSRCGPDSPFADLARSRIEALEPPAPPPAPPPPRRTYAPPPAIPEPRYAAPEPAYDAPDHSYEEFVPPPPPPRPAAARRNLDFSRPEPPLRSEPRPSRPPPPSEPKAAGRSWLLALIALGVLGGGVAAVFTGGGGESQEDAEIAQQPTDYVPEGEQALAGEEDAETGEAFSIEDLAANEPPPRRAAPLPPRSRTAEAAERPPPQAPAPPERRESPPPPVAFTPAPPVFYEPPPAPPPAAVTTDGPSAPIAPPGRAIEVSPPPAPPPAAPAPRPPGTVRWAERPGAEALRRVYPPRAAEAGIPGEALLRCTVVGDRRVQCAVISERPRNYGFGDAALRAARSLRAEAQLSDGSPSAGAVQEVRIVFAFAD